MTTFFCCRKIHLRVLISDLLCTTFLLASDGGIRALHCTSRDHHEANNLDTQPLPPPSGHTTTVTPRLPKSQNSSCSPSLLATKQLPSPRPLPPGHTAAAGPPTPVAPGHVTAVATTTLSMHSSALTSPLLSPTPLKPFS